MYKFFKYESEIYFCDKIYNLVSFNKKYPAKQNNLQIVHPSSNLLKLGFRGEKN